MPAKVLLCCRVLPSNYVPVAHVRNNTDTAAIAAQHDWHFVLVSPAGDVMFDLLVGQGMHACSRPWMQPAGGGPWLVAAAGGLLLLGHCFVWAPVRGTLRWDGDRCAVLCCGVSLLCCCCTCPCQTTLCCRAAVISFVCEVLGCLLLQTASPCRGQGGGSVLWGHMGWGGYPSFARREANDIYIYGDTT